MTFSIGQNFNKDLLEYSDKQTKHHDSEKAIKLTYDLQYRLAHYFQNNDKEILLKSQKNSGMKDEYGKNVPLGGEINFLRHGPDNLSGTCKGLICNEFPFWGTLNEKKTDDKEDKENFENMDNTIDQPHLMDQPELIENFTMLGQKEHLSGKNTKTLTIVIIVVLILLLLMGGFIILYKRRN